MEIKQSLSAEPRREPAAGDDIGGRTRKSTREQDISLAERDETADVGNQLIYRRG